MAQVLDYLNWRGDVPFSASPFNEVDNYIVSKIVTLDFTGIVPRNEAAVPIRDAVAAYLERGEEKLGALASASILTAVKALPDTVRFGSLMLSGYVNKRNAEETEQFSALTVYLPDGRHFVSFRGTDDTILAWKENLLMSIEDSVAAQKDALRYLKWAASSYRGEFLVGGHSKGGNLAVYAAAMAPEAVQDRITDVYSNDGPGFRPGFTESPGYLRIRPKLHVLLPQHSVIGTLLIQDRDYTVVRCPRAGAAAHDGFTWQTTPTGFEHCDSLTRVSRTLDEGMDRALAEMSPEQQKLLVEEIFDALSATGAVTVTDLTANKLKQAGVLLSSYRRSSASRKLVRAVLDSLVREYAPERFVRMADNRRMRKAAEEAKEEAED